MKAFIISTRRLDEEDISWINAKKTYCIVLEVWTNLSRSCGAEIWGSISQRQQPACVVSVEICWGLEYRHTSCEVIGWRGWVSVKALIRYFLCYRFFKKAVQYHHDKILFYPSGLSNEKHKVPPEITFWSEKLHSLKSIIWGKIIQMVLYWKGAYDESAKNKILRDLRGVELNMTSVGHPDLCSIWLTPVRLWFL